jgi:hypothetical protein
MVVVTDGQVSCDLADEVAILDLQSGIYYGLDAVGARIWSLIQEPKTVTEVCNSLLEEYDVEPERCERDLMILLQVLADKGLIKVKDATDT